MLLIRYTTERFLSFFLFVCFFNRLYGMECVCVFVGVFEGCVGWQKDRFAQGASNTRIAVVSTNILNRLLSQSLLLVSTTLKDPKRFMIESALMAFQTDDLWSSLCSAFNYSIFEGIKQLCCLTRCKTASPYLYIMLWETISASPFIPLSQKKMV